MAKREISASQAFPLRDKKGTKIEGVYLGMQEIKSNFEKPHILHKIQTAEGEAVVFGFTSLNLKLAHVKIGEYVCIEYLGLPDETKKAGQNNAHKVKVEVDDDKKPTEIPY